MNATCDYCGQAMDAGVACTLVRYDGDTLDRVPYGSETQVLRVTAATGLTIPDPCHDCNAPIGGLHHPGCDKEECPNCHAQAISCECAEDE